MKRRHLRFVVAAVVSATAGVVPATAAAAAALDGWGQVEAHATRDNYNPGETRLTPAAATRLKPGWSVPLTAARCAEQAAPLVGANRLVTAGAYRISGYDATTGALAWQTPATTVRQTTGLEPCSADDHPRITLGLHRTEVFAPVIAFAQFKAQLPSAAIDPVDRLLWTLIHRKLLCPATKREAFFVQILDRESSNVPLSISRSERSSPIVFAKPVVARPESRFSAGDPSRVAGIRSPTEHPRPHSHPA